MWLPGLAWPLARLPGILGFFLVFHLGPQASWGALRKPTTGPLPGTVASCVAFSLFMMAGVNVSDTAIGGLPGLHFYLLSGFPSPGLNHLPAGILLPFTVLAAQNLGPGRRQWITTKHLP